MENFFPEKCERLLNCLWICLERRNGQSSEALLLAIKGEIKRAFHVINNIQLCISLVDLYLPAGNV